MVGGVEEDDVELGGGAETCVIWEWLMFMLRGRQVSCFFFIVIITIIGSNTVAYIVGGRMRCCGIVGNMRSRAYIGRSMTSQSIQQFMAQFCLI